MPINKDVKQLIILGTGNAMVTKCYNTCFAIKNNDDYFLVDAGGGNGILVQMEKAKIPYSKLKHMFVTHKHTDHILGVIWIIRKIASQMDSGQYEDNFTIYCHDELIGIIKTFCELTLSKKIVDYFDNRILFHEVKDHDFIRITTMDIHFFDIHSTKAKQFGCEIKFSDGQRLVCLGDEPYKDITQKYVENCDWLLAEAFCLYDDKELFKPYEKHHSTALDAGKNAEKLHVKNLVLYHTVDKNLSERKKYYTIEAKSVFNGQVFVPDDLEVIDIV